MAAVPPNTRGPRIVGIVNLSGDSFSDGGRYSDPASAVAKAEELLEAGAHWIELGAASSHPDAADVSPEREIATLEVVLDALGERVARVAVDSWKTEVQRYCIRRNIGCLNDISGFKDRALYDELAAASCDLVVMHSLQEGKATRPASGEVSILSQAIAYLQARTDALIAAGVARDRIIVDPGMGFFLGSTPEPSLEVLAGIDEMKTRLQLPVLVCPSRKSFLGAVTGRDVRDRAAATLAAELYAAANGADYIRTHDVEALVDGLEVIDALEEAQGRREEDGDGI